MRGQRPNPGQNGWLLETMDDNSGQQGEAGHTERRISLPLGVVVRRRKIEHKWADHSWQAIGVLPGGAAMAIAQEAGDGWRELASGDGWSDFYAGMLPLTLHRSDTEAYRVNLASETPSVYVVMRKVDEGDPDTPSGLRLAAVTASPYEGQDYLDNGEDIVEAVPMPPGLIAWMAEFTERHHVEQKFIKRQRRPIDPDTDAFATQPIFERRRQRGNGSDAS